MLNLKFLINKKISAYSRSDQSNVYVEVGFLRRIKKQPMRSIINRPFYIHNGQYTIYLGGEWRIETDTQLITSSIDNPSRLDYHFNQIVGSRIIDLQIIKPMNEITIELENCKITTLRLINSMQWNVLDRTKNIRYNCAGPQVEN